MPQVTEIIRRGFLWAAEGKQQAGRAAHAADLTYTGMGDSN
jgi:type 1 glutamine amidotransferase